MGKIAVIIFISAMLYGATHALFIADAHESQAIKSEIAANKHSETVAFVIPLGQYSKKEAGDMTFDAGMVTIRNSIPTLFQGETLSLKYFDLAKLDNEFLKSSELYVCSETRCEKVVGLSPELKSSIRKKEESVEVLSFLKMPI